MNDYEKHIEKISEFTRSRKVEFITARYAVFYKLVKIKGYSLSEVGRMSGYSHATVWHGVRRFTDWLSIDDLGAIKAWSQIDNTPENS